MSKPWRSGKRSLLPQIPGIAYVVKNHDDDYNDINLM